MSKKMLANDFFLFRQKEAKTIAISKLAHG
jgi:hypothetical protein